MATLLQTTIAGSLPKPAWLAPPGQLWAPWLLDGERLAEGKCDAVRLAQIEALSRHSGAWRAIASLTQCIHKNVKRS